MARRVSLLSTTVAAALLASPLLAGCTSTASAEKDVMTTTCTVGANGRPTVMGTVDNHTSKASTYVIAVGFYDSAGNRVSDAGASLGKVEPSQTATFVASGTAKANGPLTCKLLSVTRTVAP
ncbi:MAG: FxLYD domain-containing protein [Acidimicrobiales bacterium]